MQQGGDGEWWRTIVWKLSIVLLPVMRVIMPLISSNPFDLVSEEKSRQPWMYRHMLCVYSLGGAELVHATYPM